MAECFCGCGRKIRFTRRAMNSTGRLVEVQLGAWKRLRPALQPTPRWPEELRTFLDDGRTMSSEIAAIVHGGPLRLTFSQREITRWLKDSRRRLVEIESEGPAAPPSEAETPQTPPGVAEAQGRDAPPSAAEGAAEGDREEPAEDALAQALSAAERRAELERLRAEYEGEDERRRRMRGLRGALCRSRRVHRPHDRRASAPVTDAEALRRPLGSGRCPPTLPLLPP